jgi:activator of HSP90 ATPase
MEFTVKTKINATAEEIYSTWMSSEGHTKMTGGEAVISQNIGEAFSAWDGYIEGENVELEPNKRILQSWRTSQFENHEEDSKIEVLLNESGGQTELTIIHSNLPESGEHYKKGWEEHYFNPMKEYWSK